MEVPNGISLCGQERLQRRAVLSCLAGEEWIVHLTYHTDYALRVLVYLGLKNGSLATISEISDHFGISRNHLVKVVNFLSRQNLVETQRGKGGGVRLARDPAEINIGEIVRHTECHFNIMACFEEGESHCAIASECKLKGIFRRAAQCFLEVLDEYTLANVLPDRDDLVEVIFMGDFRFSDL